MKRSALKVGESYYWDSSSNWRNYPAGCRAVVVDAGWWQAPRAGVLVDLFDGDDEDPARVVVPPAHLRGPWEETSRLVAEARAAARTQAMLAEQRRDELEARVAAVRVHAAAVGVTLGAHQLDRGWIQVSLDDVTRLLDAYEQHRSGGAS